MQGVFVKLEIGYVVSTKSIAADSNVYEQSESGSSSFETRRGVLHYRANVCTQPWQEALSDAPTHVHLHP